MVYRYLGNSGLRVSVLGFGNWVTGSYKENLKVQTEIMKKAYENGVNFFDTAEIYGFGQAELLFGEIIPELGAKREDLVISTKLIRSDSTVNQSGNSRKHLFEGLRNSLKRLKLDYVDVVYSHRPDYKTPLEEICRGFNDLIDSGLAYYWGTSEWDPVMIARAIEICEKRNYHKPICEQPQYNMLHRNRFEENSRYLYENYNYGTTIWSPLKYGLLTGKYNKGIPEDSRLFKEERLRNSLSEFLDKDKNVEFLVKLNKLEGIAKNEGYSMA